MLNFFDGRIVDLCPLHQRLDSPKFRKVFFILIPLKIQTRFSQLLHNSKSFVRNSVQNRTLAAECWDENRWFFLLHQNSDSPNFPRKKLLLIFRDIQTHPQWSLKTTGFVSSIKVSMKNFLVVKTFPIKSLSILFLAFDYWSSDIPKNAI